MLTGESICDKLFPQETYWTKRNLQFFQNVPQNTKRWIHVYTGSYSETVTELSLIIIHLKLLSVDLLNSILLNYSPPIKICNTKPMTNCMVFDVSQTMQSIYKMLHLQIHVKSVTAERKVPITADRTVSRQIFEQSSSLTNQYL